MYKLNVFYKRSLGLLCVLATAVLLTPATSYASYYDDYYDGDRYDGEYFIICHVDAEGEGEERVVDKYGKRRHLYRHDNDTAGVCPVEAGPVEAGPMATYTRAFSTAADDTNPKNPSVECDDGDQAIGGGALISPFGGDEHKIVLTRSYPLFAGQDTTSYGWRAKAVETSEADKWSMDVYVICTAAPPID